MSTSKRSRRRQAILDEIMAYHREQLPRTMREVPLADLRAFAAVAHKPLDFLGALKSPGVALIAECKKASPTKGLLRRHYDPVELAGTYVRAGAAAISILTDARHFQGSLDHLRDVREATIDMRSRFSHKAVPLLRKDFIFDPYQIYEARVAGADAILLIAAVLGSNDLQSLMKLAHSLEMDALVEVHSAAELERVLPLGPRIVGVNNRNLQTFEVDFDNSARLRSLIPDGIAVVGESGLRTADDVRRMADIGMDAILVGETLVKSKDVYATARELAEAGLPE